jgi:hypothetical protein
LSLFAFSHISVTTNENKGNMFYVMKEDTRIAGPWTDQDVEMPRQCVPIERGPRYHWQQYIEVHANDFDPRTIHVVRDPGGNHGKSSFGMWMTLRKKGRYLPIQPGGRDLCRMVKCMPPSSCYIVDFPRAGVYNKKELASYLSGIEQLKSGHVWDDRFRFTERFVTSPNVWMFYNVFPAWALATMSLDRWKFWTIDENMNLVDADGTIASLGPPPSPPAAVPSVIASSSSSSSLSSSLPVSLPLVNVVSPSSSPPSLIVDMPTTSIVCDDDDDDDDDGIPNPKRRKTTR